MNWIKKLLKYFNNDEDEDEIYLEKQHTPVQEHRSKHIEAKVTYQYPKGKFRFPLIPDEPDEKPVHRQRSQPRKREPEPIVSTKKVYQTYNEKSEKIVKKDTNKPFRPTIIPSPVHGFSKPKSTEIIEFELESESDMKVNDKINNQQISVELSAQQEVATTVEELDPIDILQDLKNDQFTQMKQAETAYSEDGKICEEITEFDKVVENEEVPILEDEIEEEEIQVTEELTFDEVNKPSAEQEEELTFDEVNNSSAKQEEELTFDEVNNSSDEQEEEQSTFEEVNVQDEDLDVHEPIVEESEDTVKDEDVRSSNEQTQRRSNIPFNVLMFKKDREKVKKTEPSSTIEPVQIMETQKNDEVEETQSSSYHFPKLDFLLSPPNEKTEDDQWLEEQKTLLDTTLRNFKVRARVVNVTQGPAVTRFEVHPEPGVKVNKITNLSDDIKLSLSAKDIRIEAPIPGKNTIGIEVPNKKSKPVMLKEIIQSPEFLQNPSPLAVAMGLDISGKPIVTDLKKMPHGLIAGATGSGKSVCINAMLVSLLYKASPHQVKLLLIDPKMVELAPYNHIPHLVSPVITDVKAATAALKWAVDEMERRYELFAHSGVRDIGKYNELVKKHDEKSGELPYLVIIIDELADLMMVAPGDVEEAICRIAQKARACGIHLILATQRPSVDVITGLIKANIPTRIAFSVSSQVDSRTIIDTNGADKLLGRGDMLFLENGSSKPVRVQGNFVSDEEIEQVVESVKGEMKPTYMFEQDELIKKASISNDEDEIFLEACEFVLEHGGASTSSLQRHFRIGYNRAARLIDMMEDQGIISESRGSKPRDVLITEEELANLQEN